MKTKTLFVGFMACILWLSACGQVYNKKIEMVSVTGLTGQANYKKLCIGHKCIIGVQIG